MSPRVPAVLALSAALLLPTVVTGPAEAAEGVTVTTTAAAVHAAKPKPWERLGMSQRRWKHCNTRSRPCDKRKPAPRVTNARAKVLRAARSALGRPYRYGATGPSSFDCSGLVDYAYRAAGKRLPRTTEAIARAGRGVTRARIGDVLVYWVGGRATHVGIVSAVTAAGRVAMTIVAPHTGAVVKLQRPYMSSYTVRAFLA